MHPPKYVLPAAFLCLLAACGGGGGGGGGPTDVAFTSWSTLGPNQRANMVGISQTASGTVNAGAGGSFSVTSVAIEPTVDTANSRAQVTFDGNRNISAFNFTAPQSTAGFSSGVVCSSGTSVLPVCAAETATSVGVVGNPSFHGWNYQTYGVWLAQPTATTFQAGAISVGAATPGNAVPPTGTATFTGFTSGFYVDAAQIPYFTSANVNATVTWNTQTIAFNTSNTFAGNLSTGTSPISMPGLNLNGTLSYAPGTNQFSGTVNAATTPLTGNATGRFYGPTAQEMGGVYSLTGAGGSLIGAFGARQ